MVSGTAVVPQVQSDEPEVWTTMSTAQHLLRLLLRTAMLAERGDIAFARKSTPLPHLPNGNIRSRRQVHWNEGKQQMIPYNDEQPGVL